MEGFRPARTWMTEAFPANNPVDKIQVWDREIAEHWLYADVVHSDPDREFSIRHIPETERLMAGNLWVRDGILLTRATQQLIVDLEARGLQLMDRLIAVSGGQG